MPSHRIQPWAVVTCVSRPLVWPRSPLAEHVAVARAPGCAAGRSRCGTPRGRRQDRDGLHAVSRLVGDDRLGHEALASANEQDAAARSDRSHVGVEPCRRAHGARHRAPDHMCAAAASSVRAPSAGTRSRCSRCARRAHRPSGSDALRHQRDFVLHEQRQRAASSARPARRRPRSAARSYPPEARSCGRASDRYAATGQQHVSGCSRVHGTARRDPTCPAAPRAAGHAAEGAVVVRLHLQLRSG